MVKILKLQAAVKYKYRNLKTIRVKKKKEKNIEIFPKIYSFMSHNF